MHSRSLWTLGLVWSLAAGVCHAAESIGIVQQGRPMASVVLPAGADEQTRLAGELLVRYVQESTGAGLPVATEGQTVELKVEIHVGPTAYAKGLGLPPAGLDPDGFVIRGVDAGHVVIVGPTPYGTEFGVCEFLERYVGVRWLLPGPDGTDVPRRGTLAVPAEQVQQEPAFFSRLFSGLRGGVQVQWARRNRLHGRVSFHHNLIRLFPPETYTKTHPHFFPIIKSRKKGAGHQPDGRYLPPTNSTHGWQPCFTAEGMVDEAVKNICRYFDEHPEATSYSLGVNDSRGYCECDRCTAQYAKEPNFLGTLDASDIYFDWCNKVVERVLEKHPDKYFGCLAYSCVASPPKRVKVHPRVIPYMTYDRMKWVDQELRGEGEDMTRQWQAMSPTVGWYDYIYGSPYCLPRVWFHHMAEYYRFGHAHGVRALYAEAYPNWGEGPKLYVSLKLQWDPTRDVDALLKDWFERCVGPDAAPDLAAYYAHWEDFWTRRVLDSKWFSKRGQYLRFNHPGYLEDVTLEDVHQSRAWLDSAVAKALTPKQKARAELLRRAFEYYEASAIAYTAGARATARPVETEADALAMIEEGRSALVMAEKRLKLLLEEFPKHPVLVHPLDMGRYPQLKGEHWGAGLMWAGFHHVAQTDGPARRRVRGLRQSPCPGVRSQAEVMLAIVDGDLEPLSQNPSFEHAERKWPAEWSPWVKWGVGSMRASPAAARTGEQGLLLTGVKRGGPNQTVKLPPGRYGAVAFVRVPQEPKGNASITFAITPRNAKNQNLPGGATTVVSPGRRDWMAIATAGEIPAKIGKDDVTHALFILFVNGFEEGEQVHLDDMTLFRLPD